MIKIRVKYKNKIGSWFSLLMISPRELKKLILNIGWKVFKIIENKDGTNGAVLEKY